MGSSQDPDGLGQVAVAGDWPMVVAVGTDQVSQDLSVPPIRLGPRGPMTLPVAAGGQWVDRHHLVARRHQRRYQQPTIQFDADHDLLRLAGLVSDQPIEPPF